MDTNILIAGVGGQGTLLASRIIGNVALKQGYDVKMSEVHGMSQRGGSVVTYVRFSPDKVYSPVVDPGQAHIVVAFELLEAYRNVGFLMPGGRLFANTQQINPMPVITGDASYPDEITSKLKSLDINFISADALSMAREAGTERAVNTVLMGIMAANMPFDKQDWQNAVRDSVKERFVNENLRAFESGYQYIKERC